MPWKASSVIEERLRFFARLLDGEAMTDVCREFGISRKTGYKIFDRYKEHGLETLSDRSRRPVRYANQLAAQIETLIVQLKAEMPHWGARKIRELLVRRLDDDVLVPAKSTIHAIIDRHGLVKRGGGLRHRARGTPLCPGLAPNDLWCADFKGEFKLGNSRCCFPLTVSDHAARLLLLCEALDSPREDPATSPIYLGNASRDADLWQTDFGSFAKCPNKDRDPKEGAIGATSRGAHTCSQVPCFNSC